VAWPASRALLCVALASGFLFTPFAPASGGPAAAPATAGVVAGDIAIRGAYLMRADHGRAVGYFSIVNTGKQPDVLLNVLVDGLPVLGIWHRQVRVTSDELADIAGCSASGRPAALTSPLLHWTASVIPAQGTLEVTPGLGQLELARVAANVARLPVTFAFDRVGSITTTLPVWSSPGPITFRDPGSPS
jgi:hypothetical protein